MILLLFLIFACGTPTEQEINEQGYFICEKAISNELIVVYGEELDIDPATVSMIDFSTEPKID